MALSNRATRLSFNQRTTVSGNAPISVNRFTAEVRYGNLGSLLFPPNGQ
jgi:hypothetical protein